MNLACGLKPHKVQHTLSPAVSSQCVHAACLQCYLFISVSIQIALKCTFYSLAIDCSSSGPIPCPYETSQLYRKCDVLLGTLSRLWKAINPSSRSRRNIFQYPLFSILPQLVTWHSNSLSGHPLTWLAQLCFFHTTSPLSSLSYPLPCFLSFEITPLVCVYITSEPLCSVAIT